MPSPMTTSLRHARARFTAALSTLAALAILAGCANLPLPPTEEELARQQKLAADEEVRQAERAASLCRAEAGTPFALRKKVLLLAMPLARPAEAADLPGISTAWPQALQRKLADSAHFLVRNGSAHALDPAGDLAAQVTRLARSFDAQFVIAGHIDSLAIRPGQIEFSGISALTRLRPIPLAMLDQRSLATHFDLYDGHSGARLAQLRQQDEIDTDVSNRSPDVMQGVFFHTKLGEALAALLEQQFEQIEDELACLPMMAAAHPLPDGRISIAAGFNSGLQPGDRLRLFLEQVLPVSALVKQPQASRPFGEVLVEQVYPEHAVARLDSSLQPQWRGPAVVRAW
ncbi:MAG: flagella assembly protein FlgT middle domain-containing protein [Rhodocyclaceae bacterium]|nr:flagella assembly protein FlgT middle domain-containing protein [Rhodocyclaceae bacterium]